MASESEKGMSMAVDTIDIDLTLRWPEFTLQVAQSLPGRGVTALFGHSGSGKTTLLRCVAGLERPRGKLHFKGQAWQDERRFLPPHQRPLGYVFQDANLFPHLSVLGNLRYGMKRAGRGDADIDPIIDLLGIGHLLPRRPALLSGGERQRVGIARALALQPQLLLMDEPLAALDLKRKLEILPYLERLHNELDIPMLYVTHAPAEVLRLADHVVMLSGGQVQASLPLRQAVALPGSPLFAGQSHVAVLLGRAGAAEQGLRALEVASQTLRVPEDACSGCEPGRVMRLQVSARDVSVSLLQLPEVSINNQLQARVVEIADAAHPVNVLVRLELGDGQILFAEITRASRERLKLRPGLLVWALVKAVALAGDMLQ